jgi:exonuclease III
MSPPGAGRRLRRLRPDVVALQETVWGDADDQATDLLGPGYQVARHPGRSADGVGAVMASRWPLGTVQVADLHVTERTADFPWCAVLVAEVLAGDLDDPPEAASIRFWTGRQSLDGASVCYQDAWEAVHPGEAGHTFSPRNPLATGGEMPLERGRRIDYVMVRCGVHGPTLEVAGCELAFDQPVGGVWASDHFGVVADLRVPAPRQ